MLKPAYAKANKGLAFQHELYDKDRTATQLPDFQKELQLYVRRLKVVIEEEFDEIDVKDNWRIP